MGDSNPSIFFPAMLKSVYPFRNQGNTTSNLQSTNRVPKKEIMKGFRSYELRIGCLPGYLFKYFGEFLQRTVFGDRDNV